MTFYARYLICLYCPGECFFRQRQPAQHLNLNLPGAPVPELSVSNPLSSAPQAVLSSEGGISKVTLSGDWTVLRIDLVARQLLQNISTPAGRPVEIDAHAVSFMDTAGARLIVEFERRMAAEGGTVTLHTAHLNHESLIQLMRDVPQALKRDLKGSKLIRVLNRVGEVLFEQTREALQLLSFSGHMLTCLGHSLLKPARIRFISLVSHMEDTGVNAVPIVSLLAFLIGLVIVYMGSAQLAKFGAQVFAVNLLEIATLRELGPILTAIVVAGRSGSAFTAQIGAMKSNEEISAMQVMGLEPMELLVIPRVLGLMIMLPVLIIVADLAGILGGALASLVTMDLDFAAFLTRMQETANINNFYVGLVKAPFFAAAIALVGCFHGYQVTGSAESVGRLTTTSVVKSIFIVIIIDAVFAIFFSAIGV